MTKNDPGKVVRFSFSERVAHWLAALSFLYAALSGLALWSQQLFWMASVLGGGDAVRAWHPWGGLIFFAALGVMFVRWAGQMRLDRQDRQWLGQAHRYAVHDESGLPEAGRFNAGQKALFWTQAACTLFLLASGVILWFPSAIPQWLRLTAILIHPAAAVVSMTGIIVHIYMGTAAVPGAFRAMMRGWVTSGFARSHHRKWHREISGR